jgi:tripartite-type tricarboxylate transporter receptor subunit TctC
MIAAAGAKRSKFLPDLPTVAESGVPGFATGAWWGLFGPAGLPPQVVTKIRHDVLAYLQEPEAQRFFEVNTMEPLEISPGDFTNLIRKDYDHWGALIKELGIKLD